MHETDYAGIDSDGFKHAGGTDGERYISHDEGGSAIRGGSAAAASWEGIAGTL